MAISAAADRESPTSTSGSSRILLDIRGLLAGPIAGVCSRFVTYPADTIKARLQVQGAAGAGGPAVYSGTWHAVVQVWRQEGGRGFYRGFGTAALGSLPGSLAYFGAYEAAKGLVPAGSGVLGDMAVGAAAQLVAGVVFTPVDIVKERLQVAPLMAGSYSYSGPWQAARELVRTSGPLGLLKGYWATNAVWLPWNVLFIALYEASKRAAAEAGPGRGRDGPGGEQRGAATAAAGGAVELPPLTLALCSAGSASLAGLLTHPADVVKTRLQVLSARADHATATAWSLARRMWAAEGPKVFMTGLGPRLLQLAPGTALSWVIYEPVKRALSPPL